MSRGWTSIGNSELAELLGDVANGPRPYGERLDCGGFVLARYAPSHPLLADLWEVWRRGERGWSPRSSWRRHEDARQAAERLGANAAEAAGRTR